jgi:hypothetical protein
VRRVILAVALVIAALVAVVWPWPAPEVDWQAPVEKALAAKDCTAAVRVLDAAAGAGSVAAYEKLRFLVKEGPCDKHPVGEGADAVYAFLSLYREESADKIYQLAWNDLGLVRHWLVSTSLELCANPYNGAKRIDYTQLTHVVPSGDGPVMALHHLRRGACLAALEGVAEHLIGDGDKPALRVGEAMTMSPPLRGRPHAAVLRARLTLGMSFESIWPAKSLDILRGAVWIELERAARQGYLPAIRLMIVYIHEGRHRARDAGEAYYWILRLRRFDEEHELAPTIKAELSTQERDFQEQSEVHDWTTRSGNQ